MPSRCHGDVNQIRRRRPRDGHQIPQPSTAPPWHATSSCRKWILRCITTATFLLAILGAAVHFVDGLRTWGTFQNNADAQICEASFWFRDAESTYTLATVENFAHYMAACSAAVRSLDVEHRQLLMTHLSDSNLETLLLPHGRAPMGVRVRSRHWSEKDSAALQRDVSEPSAYVAAGVRPRQEETVLASSAAHSFAHGEVARFHTAPLLPKRMLNVTIAEISATEDASFRNGPVGEIFAVADASSCSSWARFLTLLAPRLGTSSLALRILIRCVSPHLQRICQPIRTLKDVAEWHAERREHDIPKMPYSMFRVLAADALDRGARLWEGREVFLATNVAGHRLPRFMSGVSIDSQFGLDSEVERVRSSLFMGVTSGTFHTDLPDNALMQLSGESEVLIFPPNVSHLLPKPFNMSFLDWLADPKVPARKRIPFFHMILRPGDGVLIPSMSLHRVMSQDSRSIRMNSFFEPKLGKMQSTSTPNSGFLSLGRSHAAMRILWLRSISHLHALPGGGPVVFLYGHTAEIY